MKIGLISDTHIPSMGSEPPSQVLRAFEGVDLILHAGHVEIASCIEWLERIAPVTATTSWLVGTGEALPRMNTVKVVEAENHTIGMCHELILTSLGDDVIPGAIGRSFPSGESLPIADFTDLEILRKTYRLDVRGRRFNGHFRAVLQTLSDDGTSCESRDGLDFHESFPFS
jgi:hypothetical protein